MNGSIEKKNAQINGAKHIWNVSPLSTKIVPM